ncbi:asparagine synthase (glutamine-hydrolyzing) [Streptomyces sp. CBMA123]|uniref:asparagine synthase (glutamine-hydrolyzing) n=1 Tax=Streptomyces sp. CBMA123 TaxID=1896313 RepID=UPI001CB7B937|nr:asparagine synthase (glutamine-hydrolyzing) [Streptomyces sp. CBMA123]MBD0688848.1 asparagine synthase (glutamine-hydrolyzing) [Streptomyces sp. CBMA123]
MCGLCGFVMPEGGAEPPDGTLGEMQRELRHRGPDSFGEHVAELIGFGFARLGIMDPDGGEQPVYSEDQSVVAMTTGEIYNHAELRRRLTARGHTLKNRCDTEVVPHLYEEYGTDFVEHLDGQFAVVLYDRRQRLFLAARDHFGVVPLFYAYEQRTLVFGSEIKALLRHPVVRREVDPVGLDQVLTLPGLVSPRTMFKGVRSVPPGTIVTSRNGEAPREHRYWDLAYPRADEPPERHSDRYYVNRLEELLVSSVEKRLQSDVGVGLYLSGGLDSSLIGAIMRSKLPNADIPSFSAAFPERELSEARHQRLMSRSLGTTHHERFIHGDDIAERLTSVIRHTECPLKESFDTAAFALSETARRHGVKVVLTGQGADELFGGYIGYRFDQVRSSQRRGVDQLSEARLRARAWGDENFFYEGDDVAFRATKKWLYADGLVEDEPDIDCMAHPLVDVERLAGLSNLHRRSYLDLKLRLADHLLGDHGDRMAFANSVESRHPFLDRELVDFMATVPEDLKLHELEEKYLLKKVARSWIPDSIIDREKFGFTAPGSPHLLRQQNDFITSLLDPDRIKADGYFDPASVAQLVESYSQPGFRINVPFEKDLLMTVITFNVFLDVYDLPRRGN